MVIPPYTLLRSRRRRKTITLRVLADGSIVIRAPWSLPRREIDAFFTARHRWIAGKLKEHQRQRAAVRFLRPELIYLGDPIPLTVLPQNGAPPSLSLRHGRFFLRSDDTSRCHETVAAWFRLRGATHFHARTAFYSEMAGLVPADIRVSNAMHRWGSCSPRNRISLSWRLMTAPRPVIDYVIVHELAHIREKNHGECFWHLVSSIMPDYLRQRRGLREHEALLASRETPWIKSAL